ncbi:hypothetical protein KJR58_24345, partial [Escherichia coli]
MFVFWYCFFVSNTKTEYDVRIRLVGSEMCIRTRRLKFIPHCRDNVACIFTRPQDHHAASDFALAVQLGNTTPHLNGADDLGLIPCSYTHLTLPTTSPVLIWVDPGTTKKKNHNPKTNHTQTQILSKLNIKKNT